MIPTTQPPVHNGPVDRTMLAIYASKARVVLPDTGTCIALVVKLVLNGDVILHADGTATVASQSSPMASYHVNGHCNCPDAQHRAPEGWCKHRIARGLALRLAEEHKAGVVM